MSLSIRDTVAYLHTCIQHLWIYTRYVYIHFKDYRYDCTHGQHMRTLWFSLTVRHSTYSHLSKLLDFGMLPVQCFHGSFPLVSSTSQRREEPRQLLQGCHWASTLQIQLQVQSTNKQETLWKHCVGHTKAMHTLYLLVIMGTKNISRCKAYWLLCKFHCFTIMVEFLQQLIGCCLQPQGLTLGLASSFLGTLTFYWPLYVGELSFLWEGDVELQVDELEQMVYCFDSLFNEHCLFLMEKTYTIHCV